MELFRLLGTIAVTNAEANQALDETADKAGNAHIKISNAFSKIGNAALIAGQVVATGMAAITAGFIGLGSMAVQYNADMEQYQTSFEVMLGSQEEALKLVEQLKETAAKTPFEMADLASTTQLLLNYGLTADEATGKMLMLGDIAQGSADKMERIATAYGQMSSAGKVQLEDIKQMIEAGFNPLQEISESTGESMDSLYDRISEGTITVDEITASMERATSEGGKYYQSMEKQSQTLSGQLSTLKDTVNNELGTAFQSVTNIMTSTVIPKLGELAEKYIPKIGEVVETLLPIFMQFADTALPIILNMTDELFPVLLSSISEILIATLPLVQDVLPVLTELLVILTPFLATFLVDALNVLIPIICNLADFIQIYLIPAIEMLTEWLGGTLGDTLANVGIFIQGFVDMLDGAFDYIINAAQMFIALLSGDLEGFTESQQRAVSGALKFILALFSTLCPNLTRIVMENWDKIKDGLSTAWNWCKNTFTSIKNFTSGIFENIASTITSKIQNAVNFVRDGINRLKSFFNFSWELPRLKMPHFSIHGDFSLNPPSVPSFGIDWYAKGGIMTEPTAFGINPNTGNVMVGGEAGDEAIAPISLLKQYVAEAVANQNAGLADAVNDGFATLMAFLQQYIPELSNMQMVMDSGAVVGQLAPGMDAALGKLAIRNGRGV